MDDAGRLSYLLVDGENLDATLGTSILGRRPAPEDRPRWNRVLEHVGGRWGNPVRGLFFLAVAGDLPVPFVQAITAIGYRAVPLRGEGKVVDIAIQRTLGALAARPDDVVLASHDGDFLDELGRLCDGDRRVGLLGFGEFFNSGFRSLPGLELIDIEYDAHAFTAPLPRIRVIEIDDFDPLDFL